MKKILSYITIAAALLMTSCASELDTQPAGDKVSDEQLREMVKQDPDGVLAPMMRGAVGYMHNGTRRTSNNTNTFGFMIWNLSMDMQGNDMVLTKLTNWFKEEYMFNNLRAQTNTLTADLWYDYYKIVYKANQILDLIPTDVEGDSFRLYTAQAKTYRALGYYYLMCIYQNAYMYGGKDKAGVPLYLTVENVKGRTPSTQVFSTIIADLKEAIATFEDLGYDPKKSPADIDQDVANMILARAALTSGDYSTATSAAAAVIGSGYSLMNEEEYTESGFQNSALPETIFAYVWSDGTSLGNKSFASFMSLNCVDIANNKGVYMAIDQRLYEQIKDSDYRKNNFLPQALTVGKLTFPKYSNIKFASEDYFQDEIYMRLSEAYLLKAEAEARGGSESIAQQTLFDLVSKRDAAYTKSTKTGQALLDEIFLQSRIELWGEGHEFFTNKRFNVGVNRTTGTTNHLHKVDKPAGKEFTYQIPLSIEISSNPFITEADQNPL